DAWLVDTEVQGLRVIDVQLQRNLLQVEDDVGRILDHAWDRRELVKDSVDLHRGDRGAFNRREQYPSQGVADGRAEPSLERLRIEPHKAIGECLASKLETLGALKPFPEHFVCPFANGPAPPASRPAC